MPPSISSEPLESFEQLRHRSGETVEIVAVAIVDHRGEHRVAPELLLPLRQQVEVRDLAEEQPAHGTPAHAELGDGRGPGDPAHQPAERERRAAEPGQVPRGGVRHVLHPDRDGGFGPIDGEHLRHAQRRRKGVSQTALVDPGLVQPVQVLDHLVPESGRDELPDR